MNDSSQRPAGSWSGQPSSGATSPPTGPAPGWIAQPDGSKRWWNGSKWGEEIQGPQVPETSSRAGEQPPAPPLPPGVSAGSHRPVVPGSEADAGGPYRSSDGLWIWRGEGWEASAELQAQSFARDGQILEQLQMQTRLLDAQTRHLRGVHRSAIFFTWLTVIWLVLAVLFILGNA